MNKRSIVGRGYTPCIFFSPHFHVRHIKYARTKIPENREKNIESIYSNKFWHRPVVYTKPNKWAMLACSLLPTINVSKAHSPTFKQQSKKVHFFSLSQSFLKPCEIRVVHQFCSVLTVTLLTSVENWLKIEQLQKWHLVHHLFSQNWQEHGMKGKWQTKKCKIILTFFYFIFERKNVQKRMNKRKRVGNAHEILSFKNEA